MSSLLETAVEAALSAGEILKEKLPRLREVTVKGPRDVVTDADFAAQHAIAEIIRARCPDHAFLGEEGRHDIPLDGPQPVWIVDPLDGTTNYEHRFPVFAVAIGMAYEGLVQIGIVHDPLRGETFFAERGTGAFLRRGTSAPERLAVSGCDALIDAVVGVDWAHDPATRAQVLAALGRAAGVCRTVRAIGSAALSLAYLAAGWLDGYYHLSLQPWDVAAASLLVEEAGGVITRPSGAKWHLGQDQIVASNPRLHTSLLATLALR